MPDTDPLVFVLIPFDDEFEPVWQLLIKEPLESVGFRVRRADSLIHQQSILRDIVRGIVDAKLIVADVTGLNSNVLYELGLAHALGKRTIMITRALEELPFDLRSYKANQYSTQFNEAERLKELLRNVGNAVMSGEAEFSNPVQDFAPEALHAETQVAESPARIRATRPPDADADDDSEDPAVDLGTLERRVALEQLGEALVLYSTRIGTLTENIGREYEEATARLSQVTARLGDRAAGAQLAIAKDTARATFLFVEEMQPEDAALREVLTAFVRHADGLSRDVTIESDEDAEQADSTAIDLVSFEEAMTAAQAGISAFAANLLTMPNVDSDLTKACKRAGRLLTATGETLLNARAEVSRTRGLLEERASAYRRQRDARPE